MNLNVEKSILKTENIISGYTRVSASISGGSDSDIILDLLAKQIPNNSETEIKYVFFDTGLEYEATHRHLAYLEDKYNITIDHTKAKVPIPTCCKKYGQPFLNKHVSEMASRLQKHNFKWEDRSFDDLYKEYPNCKVALQWWCNSHKKGSFFNISNNKLLKEYMTKNPPTFKISNKCCEKAKKKPAQQYTKDNNIQLNVVGVRTSEGGVRKARYKTCYVEGTGYGDMFYPILWYTDEDKVYYEDLYDISHSDCYDVYGLPRTGCCGCPFGRGFEDELAVIEEYEPKLFKAVNNIFGDSYEYTRSYRKFIEVSKNK